MEMLKYIGIAKSYSGKNTLHIVRFGEALRVVQDNLNSKNFYAINPEFD